VSLKIAILGSCVTRDLFEDPALRPWLAQYTSRSSLVSVIAPPVPIDPTAVVLESAFQRRCVIEDFAKSFFARLAEAEPDWLVIDLIDERFEIMRTPESYVTRSLAFVHAGLDELGFTPVKRLTAETGEMLEAAIGRSAARTLELLPAERIIVHRARWLTRFRQDGQLENFEQCRRDFAIRHNEALEQGYDALESAFRGAARVLSIEPGRYAADAQHRWGLEPYHYEQAYCEAAVEQLLGLIGAPAAEPAQAAVLI
jgi:hypothetical protein